MLFKNARIFKSFNEVLENGFVLEDNGIIKKVGPMECCPEKCEVESLNLEGFDIYPGFVDAHSHIGMWEDGVNFEGDDGNEETDPITPHLRAIDAINPQDFGFGEVLRAGITTVVVGPGSANPIAGDFVAIKTFGSCIDDMIVKKRVGMKFSLGENPKSVYSEKEETPTTRMGTAALIRETLEKARRYGIELSKFEKRKDCDAPEFDFKSECLLDVLNRKIVAFFHCHRIDDIYTAARLSREFNLNLVLIHATEGHLIEKSLEGFKIVTGPIISERSKPELKNLTTKSASILLKKGANVAICSDHPVLPSQYLLLSCAVAIREGLEKQEALCSITKAPAEICGIYDKVGSIEEGKMANFAIFEKGSDIFSPYVKPSYVVLDGKIVAEN